MSMRVCIILMADHREGHRPAPPVVERVGPADGDVRIWLRDDGEDQIAIEGCPFCLAHQFRQLADVLDPKET
jgi:predicted lipoprotein with Yx(FWY)xxD motif